ncbi:efflux RND transporter permease subunit [Solitalea sp. MAHUQ-68]|uniref:Efflux RND transporter permease subunit n=1 Tax=Solitalea agri TaxID=2953739 RepID=A0A9X2JBS2_9SPHI|nr:efflux RND transporter permease subunit [Solitalea agri]MCO4292283.1 efflux RND transporter permease subunit [Solitalea agri]
MISNLISWSLRNRFIVIVGVIAISIWGFYSMQQTPIDAIPDLSENQVIVYTEWMGRSPQIMEDQVTFPLVTNLQGLPKVKDVRATSMFGMSFIYVIFEDNVDIYWARTRVMERLNSAQRSLPEGVTPTLGPDGTGVGHIFWYTLDAPGYDLGELRALQDWYVKFALQNVQGVSEVASFGGFQKQYQISFDPNRINYYQLSLMDVLNTVKNNNNDVGGRIFEMNGTGYIVRGLGYIRSIADIENMTIATKNSIPIRVKDIATVQMGGEARLGITEENGNGEVVGGIVVMRYGENADAVIKNVKEKMKEVEKGLPKGVKFKVAYDRSELIESAINSLKNTMTEEIILVCIIIIIFLFHFSSSLVVMLNIPIAILLGFIAVKNFGITSNIMSLSGIAIAIGVIVDDGIVMVENAYRHLTEEGDDDHA